MLKHLIFKVTNKEQPLDGGFYEEHKEDFLLGSIQSVLDKLKKVQNPDDKRYHWNQYKSYWSSMFCTVVAPISTLISYFDIKFTDKEWKEVFDYAVKYHGYKAGEGNYMWKGVDVARKRWNLKYKDKQVLSFKMEFGSGEMSTLLEKGFGVVVGYRGNARYNNDYMKDNRLDLVDFGAGTYGHVTQMYSKGEIRDSAAGKDYSKYTVPTENHSRLLRNKVYFPSAYVFLPVKEISKKISALDVKYLMAKLRLNSIIRDKSNSEATRKLVHEDSKKIRAFIKKNK